MCIWEGAVNDFMGNTMLELESLTAAYSGSKVLFGVDITARKGEITCLIGRNGVGKSTTMKAIMGLVKTPSGDIKVDGKSIFDLHSFLRKERKSRCRCNVSSCSYFGSSMFSFLLY